ncbi:50S ribosomal protein L32 [Patescibacteria group bacterium]|nr:50S ribosomal protein L32 [Patescibacteria group bacterium]MBU4458321.1 50S ribosomal protein L32 [Patescibacteria group bacterium]MCG2695924.1 50S ribosomal protein L32 [Candidatus Portnoybacteria bacterium]
MPVPKQRHTKSRRNRRRSHLKLKKRTLGSCPKCGEPILPHHICAFCGFYNGVERIDVLAKLEKKAKKKKEKELKEHEGEVKETAKAMPTGRQVKPLSLEELSKK